MIAFIHIPPIIDLHSEHDSGAFRSQLHPGSNAGGTDHVMCKHSRAFCSYDGTKTAFVAVGGCLTADAGDLATMSMAARLAMLYTWCSGTEVMKGM